MARLIDDLLSLSRIELNAHLQPNTPVDLVPIVRQVVDGLQTLARDRGVEINVAVPADELTVLGDRDELIRALENLVENALKYGAGGKRVDITASRGQTRASGSEARIAVRDYGPAHSLGTFAAPYRTFLPRGRGGQPIARWHRAGTGTGQACAQPSRRAPDNREHAGRGGHFYHALALAHGRSRRVEQIHNNSN